MLEVKIAGKAHNIATSIADLTVRQAYDMQTYAGSLTRERMLSILSGIPYDVLLNFDCSQIDEKLFYFLPLFQQDLSTAKNAERGKSITIGGKKIATIKDPTIKRLGQKLRMEMVMDDGMEKNLPDILLIPKVVAIYYAPELHEEKKYNEEHVAKVEEIVMEMNFVEAYVETAFFLRGWFNG